MNLFDLARAEKEEKLKEVEVFNFGEGRGEFLSPLSLLEGFERIRATTFSTSIQQVAQLLSRFKRIELVIGLAEDYAEVSSAFRLKDGIGSFLLTDAELEIYEAKKLHSKIYLLEGEGKRRVIVGSANLSRIAWEGKQEEVFMYSDRDEDFEFFEGIYGRIKEKAVKVVGREEVKKERERLRRSVSLKIENLNLKEASEEVVKEVLKSAEKIENLAIATVVIKGVVDRSRLAKEESRLTLLKERAEKAKKLLENKKAVVIKKEEAVKEIAKEETPSNFAVGYSYREGSFLLGGIAPVKEPDREKVGSSLKTLSEILSLIEENSEGTARFVLESIMFSFAGAYLWHLRKENPTNLVNIPFFGLLAGVSQGGKSLTFEVIRRLTRGVLYEFQKIKGMKSKADVIDVYLCDERLGISPLLLDEVPPQHLLKESYALHSKIKGFTNSFYEGVYGTVMVAFNLNSGSVPVEILRRVFYAPFKRQLPKVRGLYPKVSSLDSSLFELFLSRLNLKEVEVSEEDALLPVRHFFRELSEDFGIPLPLSERYLGSFEEFMLSEWRTFYFVNREAFKEARDEKGRTVFKVRKDELGHLSPVSAFPCENSSEYLLIPKEPFLKALGVKRRGLLKGIKTLLRR